MENDWTQRVEQLETALQEIIAILAPEMSNYRNVSPEVIAAMEIAVKAITRKGAT